MGEPFLVGGWEHAAFDVGELTTSECAMPGGTHKPGSLVIHLRAAVLADCTQHIGFTLTYSSTFMHPFYVARLLNSMDHITEGRMAFNVVASTRRADAANYGFR